LIGDICRTIAENLERLSITSLDDLRRVNKPLAHFSDDITMLNMELKRFLFDNLYRHYKVDKMRVKSEIFITRLFETYLQYPNLLPPKYRLRSERFGLERTVCDYIAGMTDRFALDEYKRLFEPYERV
jgi:dGTPase